MGPEGARYQVKVCGDHVSNPGGPIGGSWDQIRPSEDLRGPQKGFLGAPGAPYRSVKGPKCMIRMRPTQAHCVEVFWMPFGPSRPSPGLRGGQKGPKNENCHILAVSTPETASGAVVIKT